MRKVLKFSEYKAIHKMTYNELSRRFVTFWNDAYKEGEQSLIQAIKSGEVTLEQLGIDEGANETLTLEPEDCAVAISVDELSEVVKTIKGIGNNKADKIIEAILNSGVDETLWEEEEQ